MPNEKNKTLKIELYQDKIGQFRWRMKLKNGRIVAVSSEGYKSLQGCLRTLNKICWAIRIDDQKTYRIK